MYRSSEPPCNACAERFIRTLNKQCIWSPTWETIEELREGVFVEPTTAAGSSSDTDPAHQEVLPGSDDEVCDMVNKVDNASKEPGPVH